MGVGRNRCDRREGRGVLSVNIKGVGMLLRGEFDAREEMWEGHARKVDLGVGNSASCLVELGDAGDGHDIFDIFESIGIVEVCGGHERRCSEGFDIGTCLLAHVDDGGLAELGVPPGIVHGGVVHDCHEANRKQKTKKEYVGVSWKVEY